MFEQLFLGFLSGQIGQHFQALAIALQGVVQLCFRLSDRFFALIQAFCLIFTPPPFLAQFLAFAVHLAVSAGQLLFALVQLGHLRFQGLFLLGFELVPVVFLLEKTETLGALLLCQMPQRALFGFFLQPGQLVFFQMLADEIPQPRTQNHQAKTT